MSTKTAFGSPGAPAAIGPYSQGILTSSLVFLSGQIPLVGTTGQVAAGDVTAQTEQVLTNIRYLLAAQGLDFSDVVKSTVFLTDLPNDFKLMNAVYATYFPEPYPVRSTVQVAALPLGVRVEIEVIAQVRS